MERVNINILGISELKWTGMGKFNSDDHYIYYCEQESHRMNGIALTVNERVQNAVLRCDLQNNRIILVTAVLFGHLLLPSTLPCILLSMYPPFFHSSLLPLS